MTMKRTSLCVLGVLLAVSVAWTSPSAEWTWVHGQLDEASQEEYLTFCGQIHDYYQQRGMMTGPLVGEDELEAIPAGHVVLLGPVQAFENVGAFGLPLEVDGDEVTLGGQRLDEPRTGIFLVGRSQERFAYTGLSFAGFRDVFTVPTGRKSCTVTGGRGKILFEGSWGANGLVLEGVSFLMTYPSEEELGDVEVPDGALVLKPVLTEPDLDALEPGCAKWLDGFVEGQRVLFFGESHWNAGVNRVFLRLVEHLLEEGELRAVFLEINYSFTPFYDHYVTEPDDARAREFLAERLHSLVSSPSTLELLEILRVWNREHAGRPVHVACLDMEWGYSEVTRSILQPYFERVQKGVEVRVELAEDRERLAALLARARERKVVGEYPFLTPEYIENVLTNIGDTIRIEDFNVDRQRGILRNITEFSGERLEKGLVLFKGGGWHAIKHRQEGEGFYRDAACLNEVYPATKDKVVTLYAQGLGYSFAELADLDLARRMSSATNYNDFVQSFQRGLASGKAERNAFYLLDGRLRPFDTLVAKVGYAMKRDTLRLDSVDWDALTTACGSEVLECRARDYDATVYVLRAGIEVMRPKDL